MQVRAPALVCAARPHGETAVIARLLTEHHGMVAAYVAGGRGRTLRPVLVPGNLVQADLRSRSDTMLPFAKLELVQSRGPWLGEPLCAAGIDWATALTAEALPERHAYPPLFPALAALLDALCHAPSARGWVPGLLAYEALVLRELGYGDRLARPAGDDWAAMMVAFDQSGAALARWVLAERRERAMAARDRLRDRLARIEGQDRP